MPSNKNKTKGEKDKMIVLNSLSLNLFPDGVVGHFMYQKTHPREYVLNAKGLKSHIGHHDLANLVWLPCNRDTAKVSNNETFLVVQYRGPRLPEKTVELPQGAVVEIHEYVAVFARTT